MIRQIHGTVAALEELAVVVDVQGIGYLLRTNTTGMVVGDEVTLYTHLAVRENALDLYGFMSHDELRVFEVLLTLPKIGPKSALQILTNADIALLQKAAVTQDATYLSKLSGIGKKSAEKIVLGLKDTFLANGDIESDDTSTPQHKETKDTIDALISLGYSEQTARETVQQVQKEHPEMTETTLLLKTALKFLNT